MYNTDQPLPEKLHKNTQSITGRPLARQAPSENKNKGHLNPRDTEFITNKIKNRSMLFKKK